MSTDSSASTVGQPSPPVRVPKLVAVIDIGATAIRMAIAEIVEDGPVRTLENLSQAVGLGNDVFTRGSIDAATTEDCVRVLTSYRQKLTEYGIAGRDQIRVVATSAVREAANRLGFLKRIYVATGFEVEPFDEAAVNRVTFLGVRPLFRSQPELAANRTLIVEVGGGSTEVLLFQGGDVAYAHTYRLGALRLRKTLETYRAPGGKVRKIMESQIQRTLDQLRRHVPRDQTLAMVALGGDVRFAVKELGLRWNASGLATLPLEGLRELSNTILSRSVEEVAQEYHLAFTDAETVGPALLTYQRLGAALGLDEMQVSSINLRDGLLKEMALHQSWTDDFLHQIIRSALDFGRSFGFDEPHGRHVAELSRSLFRALQAEHRLDSRYEVILYIAAMLHDLGYAVNARSHHKHSMYLITNGELFGLSKRDVLLAGLTARYHRRSTPRPIHGGYATLDWESRTNVAKMAAILRVADALDRSNSQRVRDITCSQEDGCLVISAPTAEDLSLEQLALRQKSTMFKEIFGLEVLLNNASEI